MAETDALAQTLAARHEELLNTPERSSIRGLWDELSRYILPHEQFYADEAAKTGGTLRKRDLLDSTAMRSLELFASSLHSLLNNPASQWFRMGVAGRESRRLPSAVREALDSTAHRMLRFMASRDVNIYSRLHSAYMSLGGFGTACLFVGTGDPLLIREFPVADIAVDEDANGVIDTCFRVERLSLRQAVQRWPDVDETLFEERGDTEVLHAVFPSSDIRLMASQPGAGEQAARAAMQAAVLPWMSVWVSKSRTKVISLGGYDGFPYIVPRWYKARGEIYGRSPGMTVLPDVRMTNRMMETILRGAEKLVDPPLMIPSGSLVSPLRLWPGSITFTDGAVQPQPLMAPGSSRVEYGQELLLTRQQAIREGFFTPLFATPDSPVKTATQVLHQADERNRAIAPMLIRLQEELFHPMLFRVFRVLRRAGLLDLPEEFDEDNLEIEYVSPLRAAHMQTEALGASRIIEQLTPWAQIDPTALDIFDPRKIAEVVLAGSGAPADIVRSRTEMAALQAQRSRQAEAQERSSSVDAVEALAAARTADAAMVRAEQ